MAARCTSSICVILSVMSLLVDPSAVVGQTTETPLPEELANGLRCQSPRAIGLPARNICLVPVRTAYDWLTAQKTCEMAGGSLYQPDSLMIDSDDTLMRCLAAMEDSTFNNLWFNGVGIWFQHLYWINGTIVNPPTFCSTQKPGEARAPFISDSLSVDFCVSTCHEDADRFIVVHHTQKDPQCYCLSSLPSTYQQVPCNSPVVNYNDRARFYVVHAKENSLIRVSQTNGFTSSEILCATVDKDTFTHREMNSDTCFTRRPFICDLGNSTDCPMENCEGDECLFTSRNRCMKRANYDYTWFEARTYCNNLGGDLWTMSDFQEMVQVGQYLNKETKYWIGATNFIWNFSSSSNILEPYRNNYKNVRCAHMFHQPNTRWQWGDSACSQPKSFLCQFARGAGTDLFQNSGDQNVTCPWPIPATIPVPSQPTPPIQPTAGPIREVEGDDDGFPIAALVAGIIAGLILLTCLAVALTFCWRRQWMAGKFQKAKERLAFIPYFSDSSQVVVTDFDNMSNSGHMRSNMSSVSEHGSQIGLIKGGYQSNGITNHGFSSSYNEQSEMYSKTLDSRQKEAMDRKSTDNQNFVLSNNSSMDERGFASTYSTIGTKPKDYMTLQAEMNIQEDADAAAMRGSLRGKPEVTLVTDHVDMNFTVNHAMSHGNPGSDRSRSSLERTTEEITLPVPEGGVSVTLPERVTEARIITSMNSHQL